MKTRRLQESLKPVTLNGDNLILEFLDYGEKSRKDVNLDGTLGSILLNSLISQVAGKIEFIDDSSFDRRITIPLNLNEDNLSKAEILYNRHQEVLETLRKSKNYDNIIFYED